MASRWVSGFPWHDVRWPPEGVPPRLSGGSGEIRTHGRVPPSPVFKTGALNRSATLPMARIVP